MSTKSLSSTDSFIRARFPAEANGLLSKLFLIFSRAIFGFALYVKVNFLPAGSTVLSFKNFSGGNCDGCVFACLGTNAANFSFLNPFLNPCSLEMYPIVLLFTTSELLKSANSLRIKRVFAIALFFVLSEFHAVSSLPIAILPPFCRGFPSVLNFPAG